MTSILYPFMVTYIVVISVSNADVREMLEFKSITLSDNSSLYRLPKNVIPEFYDLLLLTNVTRADFNYEGEVTINLRILEKTRQVILHTDKLKVMGEKSVFERILLNDEHEMIPIKNQHSNDDTQFYIITFFRDLEEGKYLLKLYFHGEVLNDVFGFYRSSYRVGNTIRWLAVTQFSPTFARRAFPCMDEPVFKASFQLRLGHYGNETVTSNTFSESKNTTSLPDYYITKFAKTPIMSTYLLGWAIHDFHLVNQSISYIPLWTHYKDSELPYPLALIDESSHTFAALEKYTNLSNVLGKLEQIAVPDFNFQGMENWGLIAYRESVPIASETQIPLRTIQSNLVTMAHEYAHSWFGNLVTPDFWDHAWLKEGFATYFSYLTINAVHKDWRAMNLFAIEELQGSLLMDSVEHNRTMNGRGVGSPKSAKAALDFVTYKKGASIIRMVADILGEESFQSAIRSYLKEYRYRAVTPFDLYKHLERAFNSNTRSASTRISIGNVIESWANQPNYPLIKTSRIGRRRILITQQVFRLNYDKSSKNDKPCFWQIPIKIAAPSYQGKLIEVSSWHSSDQPNIIDLPRESKESSWYILNPHLVGFYRVDYETSNWEDLKQLLFSADYRTLPRTSRAALLDDVFNLARAGYRKYKLALDLAKYLEREVDYEPWFAACRTMRLLDDKLKGRLDVQLAFRSYAIKLIKPIYDQLSFKEDISDSRIQKMHRNLILSTACSLNFVDCVTDAKLLFDNWINDENKPIPGNLKDFVYRVGIINGTRDDWIKLWERFLKTDLYSEKEIMMKALSSTTDYDFINKFIEFSIQPNSDIQIHYRLSIVQSVITSDSKNINNVLKYLDENLQKIIHLRGITFLGDILTAIGKEVISSTQEANLSLFIDKNAKLLGSALDTGKNAIDLAKDNIVWINNCAMQIADYFNEKNINHVI